MNKSETGLYASLQLNVNGKDIHISGNHLLELPNSISCEKFDSIQIINTLSVKERQKRYKTHVRDEIFKVLINSGHYLGILEDWIIIRTTSQVLYK